MASETKTETIGASEARQQFASLLNGVFRAKRRVVIEKSGIPVAAVVSTEDLRRLERLDEEDREAWHIVEAMRAPFRDVPIDEYERDAALAIEESRREYRNRTTGRT